MRRRLQDSLKRLCNAVRLHVRVPVLLPAVALPTHLTLERLQAHVFVHMLLQIFCFVESLVTAEGGGGRERERREGHLNKRAQELAENGADPARRATH